MIHTNNCWELIHFGEKYLSALQIESPRISSEALLEKVTGRDKKSFLMEGDISISEDEKKLFLQLLEKRASSYPLQYLVGKVQFRGLELVTKEGVLIPRSETELMIDEIHRLYPAEGVFSLLDIGTGSGNIALSAAQEFPQAEIWAIDHSETAIGLARENAKLNSLEERVCFIQSDLFGSLPEGQVFDCIVSNPPYVAVTEKLTLPEELSFEPEEALFGGASGLEIYERILQEAPAFLKPSGHLLFEIGLGQAHKISQYAKEKGFDTLRVREDYAKIERIIILRKS